jgi:hypothetical protein
MLEVVRASDPTTKKEITKSEKRGRETAAVSYIFLCPNTGNITTKAKHKMVIANVRAFRPGSKRSGFGRVHKLK